MIVLTVSDLHAPAAHPSAIDFLADLKRNLKPDCVVCMGDEVDGHRFARWRPDQDAAGPNEELTTARLYLGQLAKVFPRLTICESNHPTRYQKRAAEAGLVGSMVASKREVFDTPAGWLWVKSALIDDTTFIHGEGFMGPRGAIDAALSYRRPVAIGHLHAYAGVTYQAGPESTLWGLNCGCLIDPDHPYFNYGRTHRLKPILGTGAVIHGIPYFFPLR